MGTHPIFESNFDCLTVCYGKVLSSTVKCVTRRGSNGLVWGLVYQRGKISEPVTSSTRRVRVPVENFAPVEIQSTIITILRLCGGVTEALTMECLFVWRSPSLET